MLKQNFPFAFCPGFCSHGLLFIYFYFRKEIGVLEEQLNHHSSAVQHSNASLKELRSQDNSGLNCSGSSAVTETADTIAPAAQSEFSASLEII